MNNPLVSICIPTFNGEKFIAEAMESAISQTYSNLEIVVSDDASKDATLVIISGYKNKTDIPIKIVHHVPNGIGANWNNCIKKARGEYIKFLFQDDLLFPSCIDKMVKVFQSDKKIGLVASKRAIKIECSGNEDSDWVELYGDLQKTLNFNTSKDFNLIDKKLLKSSIFFSSPINKIGEPTTILFKKNITKKVGFFSQELQHMLDFEFYYRILKVQKIAIIEEKLAVFRLHENQLANINFNKGIIAMDWILYEKLLYKNLFWYLNLTKKIELIKKFSPIFNFIFKIINKMK